MARKQMSQEERKRLLSGELPELPGLGGQMPLMRALPDLDDMLPDDPFGEAPEIENPLAGVDQTQPTEHLGKDELEALQVAFEKRRDSKAQAVTEWMNSALDSEYWVAFCFQTRDQKEQFLRLAGLIGLGDKYIDGRKAAKLLGFAVDPTESRQRPLKVDKRYAILARKE
jgi:hypothetical protein